MKEAERMISRSNCYGISDKGICRTSNQDSFVIEEKDGCLLGVRVAHDDHIPGTSSGAAGGASITKCTSA